MRLAEHGVSFGHWTFLRILWEGDGLTQRELSEQAGVMEPTTFSALKTMERLGYVARRKLGERPQEGLRVPDAEGPRAARAAWCRWPRRLTASRCERRAAGRDHRSPRAPCCSPIIENLARDEQAADMRMPSTRDLARLKIGRRKR